MFCKKCGAPVGEGSRFCMNCGTPVEPEPQGESVPAAPDGIPAPSPTQVQNAYGYIPPFNGSAPYGPPPVKKSMSKKAKGLMWGGIGLAAALGIAAILVFVVFAGGGLLSGNTVQTRFVNAGAGVFAEALSDFSLGPVPDLGSQPFDMEITVDAKIPSSGGNMEVSMAYDKQALGVLLNSEDTGKIRMLLLEDTLYAETFGSVSGIRFDTDADLSMPMMLKDRLNALASDDKEEVNYKILAEAFVNSIDEECFEKKKDSFELNLTAKDVQDALETFTEKLDEDDALSKELKKLAENSGSSHTDIEEALEQAVAALDYEDFDLSIVITYAGSKPTQIKMTFEDDTEETVISFGSKQQEKGRLIRFSIKSDNAYSEVDAEMLVSKASDGLELSGSFEPGVGENFDFDGIIKLSGDTLSGDFDIKGSGTDEDVSLSFERVLTLGMPGTPVEKDRRFKMDTAGADVEDLEDAMSTMLPYWMMGGYAF